ncbi:hypothetical protein [Parasitella parasitica]|uniref:Reverse transcriptase zinc-binding domain-containing protein n=1 Tax=Parasitella parasitica TaxID=35722 RepID=A0A0B7N6Y1_9FUNG|nr:hypothetical protein [Parasitella parasitica]
MDAFSVSGRDTSDYWNRSLADMNIYHLQTALDPSPLVYLGFSLIQSTLQRNNFMAAFIAKLKKTLQPHTRRSVSVLGKATIVNTLLLSKCWYTFRVIPLTKMDIQQITSVAIQFLKKGISPVIPWRTWTLLRLQGGLGTLDVNLQHAALYFRWVSPLLQQNTPSSTSSVLLLFPVARQQFTKKRRVLSLDMMYNSIDMLPRNYDIVTINVSSPQSSVQLPRRTRSMTVADVFQVHPTHHFLHWKSPSDLSLTVCFKLFRETCYTVHEVPSHLASIESSAWNFFWSLILTMVQRNVVYRFIHKCIPHQSLLHRMFPTVHLSSLCPVCSTVDDSIHHFLC